MADYDDNYDAPTKQGRLSRARDIVRALRKKEKNTGGLDNHDVHMKLAAVNSILDADKFGVGLSSLRSEKTRLEAIQARRKKQALKQGNLRATN